MATQIDIDGMFLMLLRSTDFLNKNYQDDVIQCMAYILNEWYSVPLDELRTCLLKIGFELREVCVKCNEEMPDFDDIGNPICDKCSADI